MTAKTGEANRLPIKARREMADVVAMPVARTARFTQRMDRHDEQEAECSYESAGRHCSVDPGSGDPKKRIRGRWSRTACKFPDSASTALKGWRSVPEADSQTQELWAESVERLSSRQTSGRSLLGVFSSLTLSSDPSVTPGLRLPG